MEDNKIIGELSCIVVDDESKNRDMLAQMLNDFCPNVTVLGRAESAREGARMVMELEPDIVFLDVEMPGENGFQLLEYVENRNFWVIFVTGHSHYSIQAIKATALDYILKPVGIAELRQSIGKAMNVERGMSIVGKRQTRLDLLRENLRTVDPMKRKIALNTNKGWELIETRNIIEVEADRSYCQFHLTDGRTVVASKSLKYFCDTLEGLNFLRVHRSHMVNMYHVIRYVHGENMGVIMTNEIVVPVSERRRQKLIEVLNSARLTA